ncbi:MAG: hypothetical protein MUF80_09230 [Burkholderiales bacterium]|nr:hypothetical protein [Burkholderiales bacterium]
MMQILAAEFAARHHPIRVLEIRPHASLLTGFDLQYRLAPSARMDVLEVKARLMLPKSQRLSGEGDMAMCSGGHAEST